MTSILPAPQSYAGFAGVIVPTKTAAPCLAQENALLRREKEQLVIEKRILELKVEKLQRQLWDKKSERMPGDEKQNLLFQDPTAKEPAVQPSTTPAHSRSESKPRTPRGPKPLDPLLPREKIAVPAPDLKELICPVTNQPMQPGFLEQIEVLARRAPEYFVKQYERTVFVSPAKTAPVFAR